MNDPVFSSHAAKQLFNDEVTKIGPNPSFTQLEGVRVRLFNNLRDRNDLTNDQREALLALNTYVAARQSTVEPVSNLADDIAAADKELQEAKHGSSTDRLTNAQRWRDALENAQRAQSGVAPEPVFDKSPAGDRDRERYEQSVKRHVVQITKDGADDKLPGIGK